MCFDKLPEDAGIEVISENATETGNGFQSVVVKVGVDIPKIGSQSNPNIYNGTDEGGNITICLKECLHTEDNAYVVLCDDTNINLEVDLTGGFASFDLTANLERTEADVVEEEVTYDKFVNAYLCDDAKEPLDSSAVYTQNSILKICVKSSNSDVIDIENIEELQLHQADLMFDAIKGGKSTISTLVRKNCQNNICQVAIQMLAMFFSDNDPEDLVATGRVRMKFPNADGNRYLKEDAVIGFDKYTLRELMNLPGRERVSANDLVKGEEEVGFETTVKLAKDVESGQKMGTSFVEYSMVILFGSIVAMFLGK